MNYAHELAHALFITNVLQFAKPPNLTAYHIVGKFGEDLNSNQSQSLVIATYMYDFKSISHILWMSDGQREKVTSCVDRGRRGIVYVHLSVYISLCFTVANAQHPHELHVCVSYTCA